MNQTRLTAAIALVSLVLMGLPARAGDRSDGLKPSQVRALEETFAPPVHKRTAKAPSASQLNGKEFIQWDDLGGNNPRQLYDAATKLTFRGDSAFIENFFNLDFTARGVYDAATGTVKVHPHFAFYAKPYGNFFLMPFDVKKGGFYSDPDAYFTLAVTEDGHLHLNGDIGWVLVIPDETSTYYGSALGVSRDLRLKQTNASMIGKKRIIASKKFEDTESTYRLYIDQIAPGEVLIANIMGTGRSVRATLKPDSTWEMEPQVLIESSTTAPSCNYPAAWTSSQNKGVDANMTGSGDESMLEFGPWGVFRWNALLTCSYGMESSVLMLDAGHTFTWPGKQDLTLQGEGTAENPYKIASAEDLTKLAARVNGGDNMAGKHVQQTADIDMSALKGSYHPIGTLAVPFSGYYDGANHEIKNLHIERGGSAYTGLFGCIAAGGGLKDLRVTNANITAAAKYTGIIAGKSSSRMDNVHVTGRINSTNEYVGGLAGSGVGITNSTFLGTIEGRAYTGGLSGELVRDTISRCRVSATIKSAIANTIGHGVGGITGSLQGTATAHGLIADTYFLGSLSDNTGYAWQGGIAGTAADNTLITRCVTLGVQSTYVTKNTIGAAGGIVGNSSGAISDCYTSMAIQGSSENQKTGGIVGNFNIDKWIKPEIQNCISTGQVRNAGVACPAQAIYGNMSATSGVYPSTANTFADMQTTGLEAEDGGRLTSFLTSGNALEGFGADVWDFAAGRYPVPKGVLPANVQAFASVPATLSGEQRITYVRSDITLGLDPNVTWALYSNGRYVQETDGMKIEGDKAKLKGILSQEFLTASLTDETLGGTFSRIYYLNIAPRQFEGEGTAESPYLLKTANDFKVLNKAITDNGLTFDGDYYAMANDIDFAGVTDFYGVADDTNEKHYFNATLDGRGHSIKNWKLNGYTINDSGKLGTGTRQTVGLLGILGPKGVVKNIVMDASCDLKAGNGVAPFVAICYGVIDNCRNYAPITAAGNNAAGIVARLADTGAKVLNCYNAGTITAGNVYAAGIASDMQAGTEMRNCQNDGTVRTDSILPSAPYAGTAAAAGLVGSTGGSLLIANCVNQGDVSAAREVAGIVARCADGVMLRNVVNTGMLTMTDRKSVTGGIAATNRNTVTYENVYYDRQMIYAGAAANSIYPGATGLDTRDLTAGTTLPGLPVDTFDFQAGKLPVLKAFKDEKAAVAMRNMALMLAAGENTNEVETAATLATGDGVRWTLAGDGFTLSGSTVTPKALDQPGTGTLNATLGGYTRAIGLQSMHVPFTGKGTEQEPYLLDTYADWKNLSKYNNTYGFRYEGKHFAMTKDVECDSTDNFYAIAFNSANHFMGDIDGRNHTLRHLRMEYVDKTATDTYENVGVISFLGYAGTLRNLRLNGHIRGYKYTGGLVGVSYGTVDNCHNDGYVATTNNTNTGGVVCAANGGTIRNCSNTGLIEGRYTHVGGVASYVAAGVRIENCFNAGTVSAADSLGTRRYTIVGGVVGQMSGIMRNCHNRGTVIGDGTLGGVAGYAADIDSCANYSDIAATGSTVGGVAGRAAYRMSHCYNYGNISANNYTGGVVGDISSKAIVDYCSNRGTVTGRSKAYTGGVAGDVSTGATLDSCANYGAVLGTGTNSGYVGGVTGGGTSSITLSRLVNHAPVTVSGGASTYYVAGIAGACGGTITDSYNYGAVSNTSYGTAGISGYGVGKAYRCVNLGNVATSYTGTSKYGNAGGIWGHNGGQIYDCVNYGNVSGNKYVGGIMGYSATSTKVARVYFSGKLTCPDAATTGAIIHSESSQTKVTCDSAYYNTDLCPDLQTNDRDAAFAKGVTARDLKSAALGDAFDLHPHALPTLKAFAGVADLNAAACILNFKDDESASAFRTSLRIERFPGVNVTVTPNLKVEGDKVWVVSTKPLDPATITVKGPGYERVFTVTTDNGGTGVDGLDSDRTPLSVRYFTLDGMEVTNPAPGTTVVRITLFTDGTAATEKVVIR